MKKRLFYGLLVVCLTILFVGCATRSVEEIGRGNRSSKRRVLIATQQSPFKEAVVSKVVEGLEKEACYVKIIDIKKLAEEPIEHYEAIVMINTCQARRLNRHARKFLTRVEGKEKIILLTTAGDEHWKPKGVTVDAITSASEMNKAGAIADLIMDKVQTLLKGSGSV